MTQRLRCVLVAQILVLAGPRGNLMHGLKGTTLNPPSLRPSPPPYHGAPFSSALVPLWGIAILCVSKEG
jgi:hypothetical protein